MLEKEPALFKIPYFRAFVIIQEFSSKEIRPRRLLIIFFRFCIDTIIYTWIEHLMIKMDSLWRWYTREWIRRVTFKLHVPLWSEFFANSSFEFAHNFHFSFSFSGSFGPGHPSTTSSGLLPRNVSFSICIYIYILDENTKLKTGLSFRRSPKTLILLLVDSCFRDFVLGLLYGNKFQPRKTLLQEV